MGSVYSQASATYAWIGDGSCDRAAQALDMLKRTPPRVGALLQTTKSPTYSVQALFKPRKPRAGLLANDDIDQTELDFLDAANLESSYEALRQFCERPYWRRRWIIQEVAISSTTHILCGDAIMSFDSVCRKLKLYSKHKGYWTAAHDRLYRFISEIAKIREAYSRRELADLFEVMLSTRNSLSKDARDKVFALLEICRGGKNLVRNPSYQGPPEVLTVHLAREMLKRNAAFEIILAGGQGPTRNQALPTWCPDWLGGNVSRLNHWVAYRSSRLLQSFAAGNSDELDRLHVQGLVFGTVVAMTSILTSEQSPAAEFSILQNNPHPAQIIRRYGRYTRAALGTCLRGNGGLRQTYYPSPWSWFHMRDTSDFHMILMMCKHSGHVWWKDFNGPRWPALSAWLETNKDFMISGKSLQALCRPTTQTWLVRLWLTQPIVYSIVVFLLWTIAPVVDLALILAPPYDATGRVIFGIVVVMYGRAGTVCVFCYHGHTHDHSIQEHQSNHQKPDPDVSSHCRA